MNFGTYDKIGDRLEMFALSLSRQNNRNRPPRLRFQVHVTTDNTFGPPHLSKTLRKVELFGTYSDTLKWLTNSTLGLSRLKIKLEESSEHSWEQVAEYVSVAYPSTLENLSISSERNIHCRTLIQLAAMDRLASLSVTAPLTGLATSKEANDFVLAAVQGDNKAHPLQVLHLMECHWGNAVPTFLTLDDLARKETRLRSLSLKVNSLVTFPQIRGQTFVGSTHRMSPSNAYGVRV
ncbi:hypothetical protein FA15DRAFT_74902 [Coprinopsis marcescibilis]|uniref:Uncharacterized protein n=1 Tax=Coprinopsis marcescibilis TaxID=230819 RepID=A0A5C3L6G7_COPMA|nr:hypothetical protein FA15DRAFT_74902 [Coprinopsis marcescibilis]